MRKSFKKGLALALAAALAFSTPVALGNTTAFAEEGDTAAEEAAYSNYDALTVDEKVLTGADFFEDGDNPFQGDKLKEVSIEYTINLDASAAANGWDTIMSFYDPDTTGRLSLQTHPYVCWNSDGNNGPEEERSYIDYKADDCQIAADPKGEDVTYKVVINADGITMYKDGEEIPSGVTSQSDIATYTDILEFLESAPNFSLGAGIGPNTGASFWNTEICTLKDVKISALGNRPLIKTPKAVVSESGIEVTYELVKADTVLDSVEVKCGEETVELTDGKYVYVPTASGEYEFTVTARKGELVEEKKVTVKVAVENGKVLTDADLAKDLAVTDGGEVYNITWSKLFDDVTGSIVVSDGTKTIATTDNNGTIQIRKSDMTSGVKYTVTLTASKEGYADKKLAAEVTYTAPKEDAPGSKPGTDLSKITAKPVLSYTFDDAKGIETAGDAKVSGGVLNLASTTTQNNKSYAKIESLASYDFSNGFTWTADVKVNAATSSHDWTSILMLGDSKPGNEMKGADATVGYHFTTALSSFVDFDSINGKGDNATSKLGMCGSGVVFNYDGTSTEANVDTGVGATPLNGYTFDRFEWYKDPSKCGRWDTITVTLTKDTMTLYYDGEAQLTYKDTNYAKILEATKKFTSNYIGTSYWGGDFDFSGSIDNLAFYNTALSAEDVAKLTSTTSAGGNINVVEPPKPKKISLTNISAKAGAKKITGTVNAPNATIEVQVGKGAFKKATVTGTKFSIATSKLKIGTKITFKVTAEGYEALTWYKVVRGDFKLSAVKAKKGKKKITGKVNVKKATVKIKVGKKGYKKAKLKGKKFTLKTAKLKKGTKVKIKVTKKNYNTLTKTYKVK